MRIETENIRYLLWRNHELGRAEWARTLSGWLRCSPARAEDLLEGRDLFTNVERRMLREASDYLFTEEQIQYGRLVEVEGVDILHENVRYLVRQLDGERQRAVAFDLGVSEVTFSRWAHGRQRPQRSNLVALIGYFGLPYETDLTIDAVFLWPGPISDYEKRAWVRRQVGRISSNQLRQIFPALERLLEDE